MTSATSAFRSLAFVSSLSTAVLLAACGGGSSDGGTGTLNVSLTDAPACGYDAVNVTVSKVRVHQSSTANDNDSGWTDITLNPARKINLLNLNNGALDALGQASLPAGHYTQLRLVLSPNGGATPANSVVLTGGDGKEIALTTPSAVQSGIKLINEFDVAANTTVDLVLDFDACKSIVTQAKQSGTEYSLKPVISVIPVATSGAIAGYIDPALASSNPVVSAQVNGVVVKSTVPVKNDKGELTFNLSPLTAGTYTVVLTADDRASDVIANVPVTAKASTALSTSASPIAMQASTSNSVSGTVSPASAEGSVRATQSFASGPTVTIKYQGADLATGAYSLKLPTGAPQLGQFGTLPITLSAQSAAAGKYTVEASAVGYQTQSSAVDVTSGSISNKDFSLVK